MDNINNVSSLDFSDNLIIWEVNYNKNDLIKI